MDLPGNPRPDPGPFSLQPARVFALAIVVIVPMYGGLAWLIFALGGRQAVLDEARRFVTYGALTAVGLACVVVSFFARRAVTQRKTESPEKRSFKAILVGLGLAEIPAFLGLVYFYLFRDWIGFGLFLAATFLSFVIHAAWDTWFPPAPR